MESGKMESDQAETTSLAMPMNARDLVEAAIVGAATGLIIWFFSVVLGDYILPKYICGEASGGFCGSLVSLTDVVSLIAGAVLGLIGLIRLRIFRPLLVVLAATLTLGGMFQLVGYLATWYLSLAMSVVMVGLAYGLFAWVSRLRTFWQSLAVTLLLVVVVRLVLFG